jgi:TonB family protein
MKRLFFVIFLLILSGCSLFRLTDSSTIEPKLIKQAPLPDIPASLQQEFLFYCEMLVDENGNVEKASLIKSSGDKAWDSLAVISLLNWKFSPALSGNVPVKKLIHRKVIVHFAEPHRILLAEIILNTITAADSVYNALLNGAEFEYLAVHYSISNSKINGGKLGKVDIQHYSDDINWALAKLKENEFTQPLEYGKYFAIFKRLKEDPYIKD